MNYRDYNDYELIYMVRENDEDSYYILLDKYMPIIRNISYDYYKRFSTYGYELDDFVQEAYLSFQKALSNYNDKRSTLFYTFLVICLHRSMVSFCKRITNGKKNISAIYLDSIDDNLIVDKCNIEDIFIHNNDVKEIWDIIYNKSIEYIAIFELRWNQFTFNEISILLDIPLRKTHSMYRKCLMDIQHKFNNVL